MDLLEDTLGKCTSDNAEEYKQHMEQIHRDLTKSYPNQSKVRYPDTPKDMAELCSEHGSVAFCEEDDELVIYILDK